ncbi:MAG: dTDP-4-dehydrorhamnose reductase family protein [Pyrinomonadaceae bacterium]
MKVLVLGATGMLGHKLYQELGGNFDVHGTIRGNASDLEHYGFYKLNKIIGGVDAEDPDSIARALDATSPTVVINAVGAVKQVAAGQDPVHALTVNAIFPHKLARLTQERGARLITISTDCVFSGKKGSYTEAEEPDACDLYAISKRFGEPTGANILTLRTSIIGRELSSQHGLADWFLSQRGKTVKGYVKAVFSGLTTIALAHVIADVITRHPDLSGLYHVSAAPISKYDLLIAIDRWFATKTVVEPSNDLVIDRSLDSSAFRMATSWKPATWNEMIAEMAKDETPYDRWSGVTES